MFVPLSFVITLVSDFCWFVIICHHSLFDLTCPGLSLVIMFSLSVIIFHQVNSHRLAIIVSKCAIIDRHFVIVMTCRHFFIQKPMSKKTWVCKREQQLCHDMV